MTTALRMGVCVRLKEEYGDIFCNTDQEASQIFIILTCSLLFSHVRSQYFPFYAIFATFRRGAGLMKHKSLLDCLSVCTAAGVSVGNPQKLFL